MVGNTGNWQHGELPVCATSTNWSPDMQIFIWMEKMQQVYKGKGERRKEIIEKAQERTVNKNCKKRDRKKV